MSGILATQGQSIYPTPHSVNRGEGAITISNGVNQQGIADADRQAVELLQTILGSQKKAPKLRIGERSDKIFAREKITLPDISGAYYLKVDPQQGITIIGNDERGTYYGVRTLSQLIKDGKVPVIEITDYPDILFRGSVEGFYGKPWSHRDRLAQLKFYGENKLNTYIYGPKDDPYHSSLSNHGDSTNPDSQGGWRVPYPAAEAQNIRELAETAKKYKVDFVWAIHPGQDIKWNEEDFQNLLNKFDKMYELGVRSYAVFFDDISGEGTNPVRQAELLNRLNREFVQTKADVTPLIMCPTEYNKSWANPRPDGYLSILGEKLDPSIQIMWTGDRVCADITIETLDWIQKLIKRPSYIWWNFPVTDYVRHKVLLGPSYGLDAKATSKQMSGFVSNPMENAEASKVALFGIADYTWNVAAYDYLKSWEHAINTLMPGAPEAFRTLAIHSADMDQNGHGYRRDESWETTPINPMNYTAVQYDALYAEFGRLAAAADAIRKSGGDPFLIEELNPWLTQAELLGKRGKTVMEFIKTYEKGDNAAIWQAYLTGVMTAEQLAAYNKHKPGTLVLQPFITTTRTVLGEKFYEKLSGVPLKKQIPITSFERKESLPAMMDNNSATFFYSGVRQRAEDWVGVDLGEIKPVTNIVVEQGRKRGDSDYFQHAQLEYSVDLLRWTPLTEVVDSAYTIKYNSRPVEARYVRLRATAGVSEKNWTAIRRFDVNPLQNEAIIMTNLPQVASAGVVTEGTKISIKPILEVIRVEPNGYFGIELPLATSVSAVNTNLPKGEIEYSVDGAVWSKSAPAARYIRYINKSAKAVEVNLKQFEVVTLASAQGDIINVFDANYATTFAVNDKVQIVRPETARRVTLLASAASKGSIMVICKDGSRRELDKISGSFTSCSLSDDITEIEIDGTITLHEIVWGE